MMKPMRKFIAIWAVADTRAEIDAQISKACRTKEGFSPYALLVDEYQLSKPWEEKVCDCKCGTAAEKRLADAAVAHGKFLKLPYSSPAWQKVSDAVSAVIDERKPKERWTTQGAQVLCEGRWDSTFAIVNDAEAYARYKNRNEK